MDRDQPREKTLEMEDSRTEEEIKSLLRRIIDDQLHLSDMLVHQDLLVLMDKTKKAEGQDSTRVKTCKEQDQSRDKAKEFANRKMFLLKRRIRI